MYERFFGFRERPFDLTPNPRFLYLTAQHREALSTLHYGLASRKGMTLMVGKAGTGKTTLVRAVIDGLRSDLHRIVHLNNPTLMRGEFYDMLAGAFGLGAEAAASKSQFLVELQTSILDRRAKSALTALIIDEAQSLPPELLEEVRLLANLETNTEKLLPVILVGQPEIADRLEEPDWQQFKQRIALRCEIGPLDLRDTAAYIAGRVRIAGADVTQVFTRDAVEAIYEHSHGIPRTISVICDNALVTGFATDLKPITRHVVLEVCRDFRLNQEPAGATGAIAPDQHPAATGEAPQSTAGPAPGARPLPVVPAEARSGGAARQELRLRLASPARPAGDRTSGQAVKRAPESADKAIEGSGHGGRRETLFRDFSKPRKRFLFF